MVDLCQCNGLQHLDLKHSNRLTVEGLGGYEWVAMQMQNAQIDNFNNVAAGGYAPINAAWRALLGGQLWTKILGDGVPVHLTVASDDSIPTTLVFSVCFVTGSVGCPNPTFFEIEGIFTHEHHVLSATCDLK